LGNRLKAIFMHLVQPIIHTPGYKNFTTTHRWDRMGFVFFKSYIGAAIEAYKKRLIDPHGLRRIAKSALKDFLKIRGNKMELKINNKQLKEEELNAENLRLEFNDDIVCANKILMKHGLKKISIVPCNLFRYPKGSYVTSYPFGKGVVINSRTADGIHEVQLDFGKCFIHSTRLEWFVAGKQYSPVWTTFGPGILMGIREEDGIHEVHLIWGGGQQPLGKGPYAFLQSKYIKVIKAVPGDEVRTIFGRGIVESYRPTDEIYTVRLSWSNKSYNFFRRNNVIGKSYAKVYLTGAAILKRKARRVPKKKFFDRFILSVTPRNRNSNAKFTLA